MRYERLRRLPEGQFRRLTGIKPKTFEKTLSQLSSEHGVHATQIKEWKEQGLEAMVSRFSQHRGRKKREEAPESRLFEEIGRLKVELDFLKGKLGS